MPTRAKSRRKPRKLSGREVVVFPQAKGKKVAAVELANSVEYHSIHLRFDDQTELTFSIEPGFTLFTTYDNWKTGDLQRIKSWPPIRSRIFREL